MSSMRERRLYRRYCPSGRRLLSVVLLGVVLPALTGADQVLHQHTLKRAAEHAREASRRAALRHGLPAALQQDVLPRLRRIAESADAWGKQAPAEAARELADLSAALDRAIIVVLSEFGAGKASADPASEETFVRPLRRLRACCRLLQGDTSERRRAIRIILDLTRPPARPRAPVLPFSSPVPRAASVYPGTRRASVGNGLSYVGFALPLLDLSRITSSRPVAASSVQWSGLGQLSADSQSGPPVAADLAFSEPQTVAGPRAQALGADLATPVAVFEHFRNKFIYEPYFGGIKGSARTLAESAGNDADIASAMISVLRGIGVPCRYVYGTIRLTREQAASWLAVEGALVEDLLANSGIPHAVEGTRGVGDLLIDHIWVQAYIDYVPYRGTTLPSESLLHTAGSCWVDLDPSFKQHTFSPRRDVERELGVNTPLFSANLRGQSTRDTLPDIPGLANAPTDVLSDDMVTSLPANLIRGEVTGLATRLDGLIAQNGLTLDSVFRVRRIVAEHSGLLPCTDLYAIEARGASYSELPEALCATARIALLDEHRREMMHVDAQVAALLDASISLRYRPAAAADAELLSRSLGVADDSYAAYRINVGPELVVDGVTVASNGSFSRLGAPHTIQCVITPAGCDPAVFPSADRSRIAVAAESVAAGARTALVFHAGSLTTDQLDDSLATSSDETAGIDSVLRAAGLMYLYQSDCSARILAGVLDLSAVRAPSVVRVSLDLDVETLFGLPFRVRPGRVRAACLLESFVTTPVTFAAGQRGKALFTTINAWVGSTLLWNGLARLLDAPTTSLLASLAQAATDAIPVYTLLPDRGADGRPVGPALNPGDLDSLGLSQGTAVREAVCGFLNRGLIVSLPRDSIASPAGTHDCLLAVDPMTGANGLFTASVDAGAIPTSACDAWVDAFAGDARWITADTAPVLPETLRNAATDCLLALPDATAATGLALLPTLMHIRNMLQPREEAATTPDSLGTSSLTTVAAAVALTGSVSRLSAQPRITDIVVMPSAFSPNDDGVQDGLAISARVIHADAWQVEITAPDGTPVRSFSPGDNDILLLGSTRQVKLVWDGTNEAGRVVADGTYTVCITASGSEIGRVALPVTVDTTSPTARLAVSERTVNGRHVWTFEGTADDPHLESFSLILADPATGQRVHELAGDNLPALDAVLRTAHESELPNGSHSVVLTVLDRAGNLTEVILPAPITVDNPLPDELAPVVHIESPLIDEPKQVFSGDIPFAVTATDNGPLAAVTILFDGEEAVAVTTAGRHNWLLDCAAFADGYHTLSVVAVDSAGNTTTSPTVEFLTSQHAPDLVRPELQVSMAETPAGRSLHVSATDNEDLAESRVLLDGSTHASQAFPEGTQEGILDATLSIVELARTVVAEAEDRYGNTARREIAIPREQDGTLPAVEILHVAPGDADPIRGAVTATVAASDNRSLRRVDLLLDGAVSATRWFPNAAQFPFVLPAESLSDGAHTLVARATDTAGNVAESVPRSINTSNPIVAFTVSPARLEPGLPTGTSITVSARLQVAADWQLDITGPTATPVVTGTGTVVSATIEAGAFADGEYSITLRADGVTESVATPFEVNLVTGPPIAKIAPPAGQTPTSEGVFRIEEGLFELYGTADDPDPDDDVAYRVLLMSTDGTPARDVTPAPVDEAGWHVGRVLNGALGTLDFTTTRNGVYTLRLAVRGATDVSVAEIHMALDSPLKVGQFGFSQQDLLIPVAGMPISVIRTYNSLNGEAGAFGFSWTHAIADVQLEFDEERTMVEDETGTLFSKRRGGGRNVTLTLPDGERTTFAFTPRPDFMGYRAAWTARDGVYAKLVPRCPDKIVSLPFIEPYWEASGPGTSMEAFDIPGFELTTGDGTRYIIEREDLGEYFELDPYTGKTEFVHAYGKGTLRRIEQRTGDVLQFREDRLGIDHIDPSGTKTRSVVFERDGQGRITAVFGPGSQDGTGAPADPADVTYEYDAVGNLSKVNKLVDRPASHYETTVFLYENAARPHFITGIRDPRGVQPLRTEYDPSGRLVATIDADGNRVELNHDLANRTETIYDRLGNPTLHVYDKRGNVTATTNAHGYTTRRTYDRFNNETSVTDALGRTTVYIHDTRGNRTSVADPLGNTTTYIYDSYGNQLSTTDPLGNVTTTEYDQHGNPVATVDALGNRQTTSFNANGQLTAVRDAAGTTVLRLSYDGVGNLVETIDVTGLASSMQHDSEGREIARAMEWVNPDDPTDVRLVSNETEYNAAGRAVRSVDPHGNVSTHEYNALGKVIRSTDRLGQTTEQTYDARGQVIRSRYPDGTVVETVYDANGRTLVQVDRHQPGEPANGSRTIYDKLGRAVRRERLENAVIQITEGPISPAAVFVGAVGLLWRTSTQYNAAGQVTATTDATGVVTRHEYDGAGRETASEIYVPGANGQLTFTSRREVDYDAAGRQVASRDTAGNGTRFVHDALGRRVKTVLADGASTTTAYDTLGRRVAQTDQLGQTTRHEYDAAGQLTAVILPAVPDPEYTGDGPRPRVSPRYEYTYDAYRRLRTIIDPKGRVTAFTYDEFGRQLSRVLPLGQEETKAYNSLGQLYSEADFKGQVTQCDHDALGRLVEKRFYDVPDGGPAFPAAVNVYVYDDLGRLQTITETLADGSSRVSEHVHDQDGRLVRLTTPEGTIDYEYDPATGQHIRTASSHTETRYAYDVLGRLETVTVTREDGRELAEPRVVSYAYDDLGRREAQQLPSGITTLYDYDSLNRLTSVAHYNAADELLTSFDYTLRPDGRRTRVDEKTLVQGALVETSVEYGYDALNRLTAESSGGPMSSAAVRYTTAYTYDLVGNRLRKRSERHVDPDTTRLELTNAQYDANDRLIAETLNDHGQVAEKTHTFDPNGALIASLERAEGTGTTVSSATYTYTVQNRLAGALIARTETDTAGNKIPVEIETSYAYDHNGIRVASVESVFDVSTGARTTQYVDDATAYLIDSHNPTGYAQVLEEHDLNGLTRSYTLGDDVVGQSSVVSGQSSVAHFLYDGHGNTRALTDPLGEITNTFTYDAYGVELNPAYSTLNPRPTTLAYCGEQQDDSLNWNYHRARYYNPQSTTWNRQDPYTGDLTAPQSLNKYAYCHQDPVNGWDPSGEKLLSMLVVAGMVGYLASCLGTKIAQDAGESRIKGRLTGFVGGFALTVLLATRGFAAWEALVEIFFISIIAVAVNMAVDFSLRRSITGLSARRYAWAFFEAFCWGSAANLFKVAYGDDTAALGVLGLQTLTETVKLMVDDSWSGELAFLWASWKTFFSLASAVLIGALFSVVSRRVVLKYSGTPLYKSLSGGLRVLGQRPGVLGYLLSPTTMNRFGDAFVDVIKKFYKSFFKDKLTSS